MHRTATETSSNRLAAFVFTLAVMASTIAPAAAEPNIPLVDLEGQGLHLHELYGKRATLLVFWATWCGPCRAEIPKINEVYRRFNTNGLAVLAVNPGIRDNLTNIRLYVDHFQLEYPVFFDADQASRPAFGLIGTPTIILLDSQGHEIQRGDTVDLEAIEKLMNTDSVEEKPKSN